MKYPQARRTFVQSGVLTRTGLVNLVSPNGKRAVHTVSSVRPISTARPVSTARPFAPKIAQTGSAIRPIYPRMNNVRPRASYSPIKRSYYTRPAVRPKDLKQDVKISGVKNMTTAGTKSVVSTSKGKVDNALKKSRWVWRPTGNYIDHVSKEKGSFILKKFEYVAPKGISKSVWWIVVALTILNTLVPLGKFDGKSDEGYLLGYSTTSKAFRVYKKRTKRVEESMHIDFLEDQPNMAGSGPD
ncbi:hypothetical protein Tco_1564617 [Tanacetum coccineum]